MENDDLPLFAWRPPRQIIVFPMANRIGRIRDVAEKILGKPTEKAATSYRNQVTDALLRSFDRAEIPEDEQDEHLGAFWSAVQHEMIRKTYQGRRPGGDVA